MKIGDLQQKSAQIFNSYTGSYASLNLNRTDLMVLYIRYVVCAAIAADLSG